MKGITFSFATLAVAALLGAACTVHQTEAPALSGPSEAALSFSVTASPDSISQDGRSTSTIGLQARDASGRAVSNVPFRLDIRVDGVAVDYGTLSNRNLTTGSDGRTSAVYTAPPAPATGSSAGTCSGGSAAVTVAGRCVQIVATSVSNDYSTSSSRTAEIHLIPVGVIVPGASTPVANFTVTPSTPKASEAILFDASKSCAGSLDSTGNCPASAGTIVSYEWSFGDSTSGSGRTTSHTYTLQRSYLVTLTVTSDKGVSASSTQAVNVGAGSTPTPAFTFSPSAPSPNQDIYFDATTSKPGTGHVLTRYVFNFGDGSTFSDSSMPTTSHRYTAAGTYQVTLTVADDSGQTASITQSVAVGAGTAPNPTFTYSPTSVTPGQTINFDATQSTAGVGRTLAQYTWNWGDGTANTATSAAQTTHVFVTAGTYQVILTVTDDLGQTKATAPTSITVGVRPTAKFVFSPTNPVPGGAVNFDASQSTAEPGHSIVQYQWNWGDGSGLSTSSSPLANHTYAAEFTYTVTLTVTDERGQTGVTTVTVPVKAPAGP